MYKNLQEVFDTAVVGLASQGFQRSVGEYDRDCFYRGTYNRRCAIGWLIPDEVYTESMENSRVSELMKLYPDSGIKELFDFSQVSYNQLNSLQRTHDGAWGPKSVMDNLREFAQEYDLVLPDSLKEVTSSATPMEP